MLGRPWDPLAALLLFVLGSCYGYVLLSLYESTKAEHHRFFWRLLGVHFLTVYVLALLLLLLAV